MQSNTTVACRALVMLACLIAIPLAALFGTSLPDLVRRLLDFGRDAASAWAEDSVPEPPFGAVAHAAPWHDMASPDGPPNIGDPMGDLHGMPESTRSPLVNSTWSRQEARPAAAWDGGQGDWDGGPFGRPQQTPALRAGVPADPTPSQPGRSDSAPAGRTAPVPVAASDRFSAAGSPSAYTRSEGPSPPSSDQFTYIQRRLRELGATYYLLETWGAGGQYYRFHARMAVGGSPDYVRHFEATETDALRAMAAVLQQVERWRIGR